MRYIADFYIAKYKIIIEIDGAQHYDEENKKYDKERDEFFKSQGILVLRYTNKDINIKFEGVCVDIMKAIASRDTSSPDLVGSFPSRGSQIK